MKKDIGLGISPPEKPCQDAKCAWHGKTPLRGRVFEGIVRSARAHNTIIVERPFTRYIPKYERYERSRSRMAAHNPPCIRARAGERVVIAECRKLSKIKSFVAVGKV